MKLINLHRRCLGLEEIDSNWDEVKLNDEITLYFDGDVIRKLISTEENGYEEYSYNVITSNNRTMIEPKTSKGKPKKLTAATAKRMNPEKSYIYFHEGDLFIRNYTSQTTFYDSINAGIGKINDFESFLEKWVNQTDETKLKEAYDFLNAKRIHCKFKEGDIFRFKFDRDYYGYGRIILDINNFTKSGGKYWKILGGKPFVIQVFHIVTKDKNVALEKLIKLKTCPAQHIMDNKFFYGEFEIIGNSFANLNAEYPIMYGKSINAHEPDKIMFQCGKIYKELSTKEHKPLTGWGYQNNGIGWNVDVDKATLEKCIFWKSNLPFWKKNDHLKHFDLRHPENKNLLSKVLNQFGIDKL